MPESSTPNLIAFGGKQGVVYLLDADAVPPAGLGRCPCSNDAAVDRSLHARIPRPQFDAHGPLSVFGPYSDEFGEIDHAKMRTKLAEWSDDENNRFLFASGTAKNGPGSTNTVAPSIAKLRVPIAPDGHAFLENAAQNEHVAWGAMGMVTAAGAAPQALGVQADVFREVEPTNSRSEAVVALSRPRAEAGKAPPDPARKDSRRRSWPPVLRTLEPRQESGLKTACARKTELSCVGSQSPGAWSG